MSGEPPIHCVGSEQQRSERDVKERPPPNYLLKPPLVAEHWEEGLERLSM